jgi:hypothetical protein
VSIEVNRQVLSELFQLIKTDLSDISVEFILELIAAHEWEIALETIYDFLDDNQVLISRNTYNLIQRIANTMGIKTRNWHSLESQIQE